MASLEDKKKLLDEIQKIEDKIQNQNYIQEGTRKRYNELLKESAKLQKLSIDSNKIEEGITRDLSKLQKDLVKSSQSKLGLLLKGNVQGLIEQKNISKTLSLQIASKESQKKQATSLKALVNLGKITVQDRNKLLNLQKGIADGSIQEQDIAEELNGLSDQALRSRQVLQKIAMKNLETRKAEVAAEEEAEEVSQKITQNFTRAGVVFGALLAIGQRFASTVDAIGNQFGSLNVQSDEFKNSLIDAQMEVTGIGANIEDVVATTSALAGEFGISATDAADLSAQIIDTAKAVGLTNEEAAKLSGILQVTSGLSAEQAEQLTEGAFQLAVANNVAPDAVLKDLASSAEEFAMFSQDGGDNLAKAAVQARALGLSIQDTAKISEGLLNFQDSITKEVEASVLIGRQLNLQKARELALSNDIEGAMREVVAQVGSEAEFAELNAIQRKALADSIGVEVSQLAKLVANSEKANVVAGETAKSFQDIIGKEAMSELTATMNELKVFGVAVANTLGPPLMAIAKLANTVLVPLGNLVVGISSGLGNILGGITGASIDDGVVGPGGISMMAGSAGVFKLNPRDSVMATTNPIPVNDIRTGPPGSMGGGTNVQISSKMVKLGGGDLGLAIDAYTYPSNSGQARTNFDSLTSRG